MNTETNGNSNSAQIKAVVDGHDQGFYPNEFSGDPSQVNLIARGDTTHLKIRYGKDLAPGSHEFTGTGIGLNYLDPVGRIFSRATAGTLRVTVAGDGVTHNGTLTGVKVEQTGSGTGSVAELSGTYTVVVTPL